MTDISFLWGQRGSPWAQVGHGSLGWGLGWETPFWSLEWQKGLMLNSPSELEQHGGRTAGVWGEEMRRSWGGPSPEGWIRTEERPQGQIPMPKDSLDALGFSLTWSVKEETERSCSMSRATSVSEHPISWFKPALCWASWPVRMGISVLVMATDLGYLKTNIIQLCCLLCCFSCVWLFETLYSVAHQAPLSVGFSRQEY